MNLDPRNPDASVFRCIPKGMIREVWIYLMCAWAGKAADPVSDWVSRVLNNGGALPSVNTITAMSSFVSALVSCGIWAKMRSVCCFVPDNLIAAITPLVHRFGNDPWTNNGWVAGQLTANGLGRGGIAGTEHLDTGFNPSIHFSGNNDMGISICVSEASSASGVCDIGASAAGPSDPECSLVVSFNGVFNNGSMCKRSAGNGHISGNSPAVGNYFVSLNRTAALTPNFQIANGNTANAFAVRASAVNTHSGIPNFPLFAFINNAGGVPTSPNGNRLSFIALHDGLTVAQQTCLFNAVQALRTSMGGGNV